MKNTIFTGKWTGRDISKLRLEIGNLSDNKGQGIQGWKKGKKDIIGLKSLEKLRLYMDH